MEPTELFQLVQAVSLTDVLQFVSVILVPELVDVVRTLVFHASKALKLKWLENLTISSKFGVATTMAVSFISAIVLAIAFGSVEPTLEDLGIHILAIFGLSQAIYKGIPAVGSYEKSKLRKIITASVDLIGEKSDKIDTKDEQVETVG